MNKKKKIESFDPSAPGAAGSNIYGLPFTIEESEVVIIPVPWEVTVSYKAGTADGPAAVFDASFQVDLFDPDVKDAWKAGLAMEEISTGWKKKSDSLRKKAVSYIKLLEKGENFSANSSMKKIKEEIDRNALELKNWLKKKALDYFSKNKLVAVLGGDHSTPLGLIEAFSEKYRDFGILHIDAHFDLRKAYEGFEYSHASIMYNALKIPQVKKLVSVGIRDYCEEEIELAGMQKRRVIPFLYGDIQRRKFEGKSWKVICLDIIKELPQNVYISFDIDGLDPKLCPNTGTPVPGGLEYEEAVFLIHLLVKSGKKIIGFDLNEVCPSKNNDWDANVGARLLYRLCNLMAKSNRRI